ncbi:RdgB/HAM1 family non-canonical purine NTP pyrophosphatase [Novispirillum itersonii]|uniref:dITP/XTP pyrophosphatase n=1 Tax=Novispirillum itersonii TaxID=189 RepID=A0A7W9ZDZ6_NOVIT|nr:RdgB/HAM1 family non-canonical purine NTP pyrophosphatase [Novispirillum itersonii]MBB6209767.1 XTP/dITP diphosphohydrolase [Novispirillum itersonii]
MTAPRRLSAGDTLIVASHNAGKVREIRDLLAPFSIDVRSAGDLNLPEPEETGSTYAENAILKAVAAATAANLPALSDDSGVSVSALDGAPGIYSARWAGPEKDFEMAMSKVIRLVGANPDRAVAFICVLCVAWPDGHTECFEGRVDGTLTAPPRGTNGFGYDPMFTPDGYDQTFGEMDPTAKHAISHRARAFTKLVESCFTA